MAGIPTASIARSAERIRQRGRGGDTILAHISKREAAMLKRRGGSGKINPRTGLPEFAQEGFGDTEFEQSNQSSDFDFDEDDDNDGLDFFFDNTAFSRDFSASQNLGAAALTGGKAALGVLGAPVTIGAAIIEGIFGKGNAPDFLRAGEAGIQEGPALNEFGGTDIAISPDEDEDITAPSKSTAVAAKPKVKLAPKPKVKLAPKPTLARPKPKPPSRRAAARRGPSTKSTTTLTGSLGLIGGANIALTALGGLSGNRSLSGPSLRSV